jgi:hypothetical protein
MTTIERRRYGGRPTVRTWAEPTEWTTALREFTARNVGRQARLEVDDPALGTRTLERDGTIISVAYEGCTACVDIVVADIDGAGRHRVHSIARVTSVDLLTSSSGRDLVLRIVHRHGRVHTLLTLRD